MCHQKKAARRAAKQARRSARPIVVHERRPGILRMLVEHFIQSRQAKRGLVQQAPNSTLQPEPRVFTRQEYGMEKVELEGIGAGGEKEIRVQEEMDRTELPSYGQVMKQV
ncbi:hypothetical protein VTL71DRAFT_2391 [Oculimacula yallundae]|uniref:Uncharacterized protein n=1 Tax=Oculimacula yallundae TaxID=86028 RepID=A0ABR4C8U3_9HELO